MNTLLLLSPFVCMTVGGLSVIIIDAFASEETDLATLSTVVIALTGLLSGALLLGDFAPSPPGWLSAYFFMDRAAYFFDFLVCVGAGLASLIAGAYLREHGLERGEFYPLFLFTTLGALVLVHSSNLLSIFLGLETLSLGVYSMVAFRRTNPLAAEGAVKYFLLGSFATAVLLFGAALLYGATGHTHLPSIAESIRAGNAHISLVVLATMLLVVGLTFKISAVPFHMWTPDAYEGAMTPITNFMAVTVKGAVFAVILRVLVGVLGGSGLSNWASGWPIVVAGLAAVSMVLGNVAGLLQSNIKRMLAYSSIAHAGYILVGVVATHKLAERAVSAVLFYLVAYTVSSALAFGSLVALGSKNREVVSFEDLAGAGRRHPLVALPFVLGVLSLMGFPPTAGFFGKYYIFSQAVEVGGGMLWLAIIGVLSSAIGAYYYLRIIVYLFMKTPLEDAPYAVPMRSSSVGFALAFAAYVVLRMGLSPNRYLEVTLQAAKDFI